MLSLEEIRFRIYSGFIGKAIGVRHGTPVEPEVWTYERIQRTYGEITTYLRDYKNFAADDDTNGPIYFIRAMRDFQLQPTAEQVGKTWLNYAAEGHGMYWWGGFGVSTEHTAYKNMLAGIEAPKSGSIAQNGADIAEQIGGQIFIDSWGWVNPSNPTRAADMSEVAASVAHDGNGLYGARFVAAMIAAAFEAPTVSAIFATGLAEIPKGSEYARVVNAVLDFYEKQPNDWRACRQMLAQDFGYDRYPGVCHIIPNAGVLALAMIYGKGELTLTVEIATMCGWDTDCNAGNAGAIIGTFEGLNPSWDKYRKPINDVIIASGVTGSLNVVDIPTFATELTSLGLKLEQKNVPENWETDLTRRGVRFDFELEGSTHGFKAEGVNRATLNWSDDLDKKAIKLNIDRIRRNQVISLFWKPFYRREDFDDNRYRPMFSPLVATGQTVSFEINLEHIDADEDLYYVPYIRRTMSQQIDKIGKWKKPSADAWETVSFDVPETGGEAIDEIGILVEYTGRQLYLGNLYLTSFEISGLGNTYIDPRLEAEEWEAITRFTWNRGYWKLKDGRIIGLTDKDADLWTGHAYATDLTVSADIMPLAGHSHLLTARAQGATGFYAAGFEAGKLVIVKQNFGTEILAEIDFQMNHGQSYQIAFSVIGDKLSVKIDGKQLLRATDNKFAYGMCGLRMNGAGRMSAGIFEIIEV
ncbi:MAG: ADP-ribosylglycohydrolase family protein [Rhizobiales bacterium]|nr:ADP-ribosylglycohydrolase family protein [Hyphomicrobiales bacterium]NRB13879.1 ADP-ribosylglycohydrolase family protein [Hyphomicrobiales bacterium]